MSQIKNWETLAEPIFEKMPRLTPSRMVADFDLPALQVSGEVTSVPGSTLRETWNVCRFSESDGASLNLKQDLHCLPLLGPSDSVTGLNSFPILVCESSSHGSEYKKNLLMGLESQQKMDAGIEPFVSSLWKSQLTPLPFDLLDALLAHGESVRLFRFSSLIFDLAGASASQQVALLLSQWLETGEQMAGHLSHSDLLKRGSFEVSYSGHLLSDIVKTQGLKVLLQRLCECLDFPADEAWIWGTPSPRYMSTREPWTNILRLTTMNMASQMSGNQGFIHRSYDEFSGGRHLRLSRNMSLIQNHEAYLHQAYLPWTGSYSFETLLETFCSDAWLHFQEIQKKGGFLNSLQSGWIQEQIANENFREFSQYQSCERKLTGVNEYVQTQSLSSQSPLVVENEVKSTEDWWIENRDFTENSEVLCEVKKLPLFRIADSFEKWQYQADRYSQLNGQPLQAILHIEKGQEGSAKTKLVKEFFNRAGISTPKADGSTSGPLHVVISFDPDGEFTKSRLMELKSQPCYVVWAGHKELKGYDDSVGFNTDWEDFMEKLFHFINGGRK